MDFDQWKTAVAEQVRCEFDIDLATAKLNELELDAAYSSGDSPEDVLRRLRADRS